LVDDQKHRQGPRVIPNFSSGTESWPAGPSYAQWLQNALLLARGSGGSVVTLFDSSTAEPTELLRRTVAEAFAPELTPRYQNVFAGGNPYVVAALAGRYGVAADQVLCTTGATSALSLIYRAFLQPGDRVLVESPGFDLFTEIAASLGVAIDYFQRSGPAAQPSLQRIAAAIQPRTRLIVVSNLHNPTGMAVNADVLAGMAALAEKAGAVLVVDEVYHGYTAADPARWSAAHLSPSVIAISSLAKVYGLGALRCGWAIGDAALLTRVREIQSRLEFGVSRVTHAVAALVLEQPAIWEQHWRDILQATRPVIAGRLAGWQAEGLATSSLPEHGCICFVRVTGVDDTLSFSNRLAAEHRVIVAPGEFFGAPGFIRVGFSRDPDVLSASLDRLEAGLRAR
jgi:aspartate/methionine/tyrosine aminotransferase